jgi:hypothetical protein
MWLDMKGIGGGILRHYHRYFHCISLNMNYTEKYSE